MPFSQNHLPLLGLGSVSQFSPNLKFVSLMLDSPWHLESISLLGRTSFLTQVDEVTGSSQRRSNWESVVQWKLRVFEEVGIGRASASLVAQMVKRLSTMRETQVRSLGWEDPWRTKWQPTPVLLPGKSHG